MPYVKKIIEAFNIPLLEIPGYEADDVIGTLSCKAEKADFDVYMMSPDKDFCQLVTDHVYLYKPAFLGNGVDILDVKKVCEKWEISNVKQVIDILGLMGDAVDNIPGIPGIGEKTAKTLIQKYGSVENLIASVEELKGKQRENIITYADQGLLSKELATIHLDVPVDFDEKMFEYTGPDEAKLKELFEELEFRQLAQRILGTSLTAPTKAPAKAAPRTLVKGKKSDQQTSLFAEIDELVADAPDATPLPTGEKKNINNTLHDYHLIDTPELRTSLISYLLKQKEISFDTETNSIDPITARLIGMSFCYMAGEAYYVPVPEKRSEAQPIIDEFRAVLENENIAKIGQNIKYDILVLKSYNLEIKGPIFDTMLAHYLLEPDMRHNMDLLSETYLGYTPISITELIGKKGKSQLNMSELSPEEIYEYACEDADVTLRLKEYFAPRLEKAGVTKLFTEIENPLVPVLAAIEKEGITIDAAAMAESSKELSGYLVELEKRIFEIAGTEFNIGSPKQLGEILFERLGIQE
ncbi:MAG: DNA polymerase I, partial [Cytophagales bacterium CG18_big_fil_WC_8_21_14_2_50_42_9]